MAQEEKTFYEWQRELQSKKNNVSSISILKRLVKNIFTLF